MKYPYSTKPPNPELKKLILSGALWSGQAQLPPTTLKTSIRPTSDYTNNRSSNTSPPTYFSDQPQSDLKSQLSPINLKSTIQEIFLETGIEDQSRNFWLPAFSFACENIKALITQESDLNNLHVTKQDLSIAWICKHTYPNLEFLCAHGLQDMIHLVFTPPKEDLFSFIRRTIKANCFSVIVACAERLSFSQTRSLKLVSKNTNSINLLLRPPWEKDQHSASFIKYLVKPKQPETCSSRPTSTNNVRWNNQIIKLKAYEESKERNTLKQSNIISLATK